MLRPLVLRFETMKLTNQGNGVVFGVALNGETIWRYEQNSTARTDHTIRLNQWAGQSVQLTFSVDPLGNGDYDQSVWISPRIVQE